MREVLAELKKAAAAKKYWTAEERRLKAQVLQDGLDRARAKLKSTGKDFGTVGFDLPDGGKVKFAIGRDRKVNQEDVARVLVNRPDMAKYFKVAYTIPGEKDLAALDPQTRALILECTTTTETSPTVAIDLGDEEEDEDE